MLKKDSSAVNFSTTINISTILNRKSNQGEVENERIDRVPRTLILRKNYFLKHSLNNIMKCIDRFSEQFSAAWAAN